MRTPCVQEVGKLQASRRVRESMASHNSQPIRLRGIGLSARGPGGLLVRLAWAGSSDALGPVENRENLLMSLVSH